MFSNLIRCSRVLHNKNDCKSSAKAMKIPSLHKIDCCRSPIQPRLPGVLDLTIISAQFLPRAADAEPALKTPQLLSPYVKVELIHGDLMEDIRNTKDGNGKN